jgi:hypothetical protein
MKKKANERNKMASPITPVFIFRPVCEISILVFSASIVVVSDLGFEILALTCTSEAETAYRSTRPIPTITITIMKINILL